MIGNLSKINVRPGDVLVTLAALLAEHLQVAIVAERLLLLHRELFTDQLAFTRTAGEALAMEGLVLQLHPVIPRDVLVADVTARRVLPQEAVVAMDLVLAAHELHPAQRLLAFGALEAECMPNVLLVRNDALMADNLPATYPAVEFTISGWLRLVGSPLVYVIWSVHRFRLWRFGVCRTRGPLRKGRLFCRSGWGFTHSINFFE